MSFYSVKRAFAALLVSASVYAETSGYLPLDFSEQIRTVLPSVVKIKIQRSDDSNEESELIAFEGGGSGFVFDRDHHVITNAHVIKGAKKIVLIDLDRNEFPASLVGSDEKTDVAVLYAPTLAASPLSFGTSSHLSIGQPVFVIGSPFSLGHSVSAGIISMIGRHLPNYPYLHMIQTDAAINPGNSGGAVFNPNAEVIGMASTYYTKQGNYTNIGFAIASDDLIRIGEGIIRDKQIKRGYLGIETLYSENVSRKIGYPYSVLVTRVFPGSAASVAGLRTGDRIIRINGKLIADGGEWYRLVEQSHPGDTMVVSVLRNKESTDLSVVFSTRRDEVETICNTASSDAAEKLGLVVCESAGILKIAAVSGSAKMVGIDSGDRLASVNSTKITTLKELNELLGKLKNNEIALLALYRGEDPYTVPIAPNNILKYSNKD